MHARQSGVPKFDCGILVVARDETTAPIPLIMIPFGNVPKGSLEEYSKRTWGKVIVLHNFTGLESSQDVPDYEPGRFTGAIRAGGYILAFGGLKGFYDELLMVILAIDLGLIEEKDAVKKILKPHKSLSVYTEYMKVWRKSPGGKRTRA